MKPDGQAQAPVIVHEPPFKHGDCWQERASVLNWHCSPPNPAGHEHVKVLTPLSKAKMHVPPLQLQVFTWDLQVGPVRPGAQKQANETRPCGTQTLPAPKQGLEAHLLAVAGATVLQLVPVIPSRQWHWKAEVLRSSQSP